MDFPELIRSTRKELNETQTAFAKRFDVSHAAVSDWERGICQAPYSVLSFCLTPRDPIQVKLTEERKDRYVFVFRGLEERLDRLRYEKDRLTERWEGIDRSMNDLWAQMNTLKRELKEEGS